MTVDAFAAELAEVAGRLRAAGETGLRRELVKAIRDAAAPIPGAIRAGLPARLPDRYAGVLNADLKLGVSVRAAAGDPGVSVWAEPAGRTARTRRLHRLESGVLWHPVFAEGPRRSWEWAQQAVTPGWFSGPAEDAAPRVRAAIDAALDRVKDQIWRGI